MRGSQRTSASRTRLRRGRAARGVGLEHQVVDAAAELGQHQPLARGRAEHEPDALPDLLVARCPAAARRRARCTGKRPAAAEEVAVASSLSHRSSPCPRPRPGRPGSVGSLQVSARSPARAAGLPLIRTLRAAGADRGPVGSAGSRTCRRAGCAAACWSPTAPSPRPRPMMLHVGAQRCLMMPLNGCGTVTGGAGARRLDEVDVERRTRSPCFAAGAPIAITSSVDVHVVPLTASARPWPRSRGCRRREISRLPERLDRHLARGAERRCRRWRRSLDAPCRGVDHDLVLAARVDDLDPLGALACRRSLSTWPAARAR